MSTLFDRVPIEYVVVQGDQDHTAIDHQVFNNLIALDNIHDRCSQCSVSKDSKHANNIVNGF